MLLPFASIRRQWHLFLEHASALQTALMGAGGLFVALQAAVRPKPGWGIAAALAWSGMYLMTVSLGSHPSKGYWCFAGAPLWLCCGMMVATLLRSCTGRSLAGKIAALAIAGAAATAMVPGSGLRALAAHVRHWSDIEYDAPRFTRQLIASLPEDERMIVDGNYIFAFYFAKRDVLLALNFEFFFVVEPEPYDLLVAGDTSLRDGVPAELDAEFVRAVGDPDDPFACYAEVFRAPAQRQPRFRRANSLRP
jgi:hypothetical protein